MRKRYVVGFAFDSHEQTVVVILKKRPKWQQGRFNGIGGHIEDGETPAEAMRREFREETGFDFSEWVPFALVSGPANALSDGEDSLFELHCFRCILPELAMLEEETEEGYICRLHMDDLPKNVLPNLKWLIPMAGIDQSHQWVLRVAEQT